MEPEVANLCSFCLGLTPPKEVPLASRTHHMNIRLLEQSSQTCSVCKMFLADWSLKTAQRRFPDMDVETYMSIPFEIKVKEVQRVGSALSWAILETNFDTRGFTIVNHVSITTCDSESSIACQPIWRTTTTSTSDKISTAKSWLHDCELRHWKCKPLVTQIPKRLIEVGSFDGRPPRLVICDDLHGPDIRYATLSYCWGKVNFCTTKANESSHQQEIPYRLLPPTLQDALTLTRHLNIQFLWIDALCIVQDDRTEWEVEVSRMQDIYSGSSITIAATDAADGSVGCFNPNSGPKGIPSRNSAFLAVSNAGVGSGAIVRVQPGDIREYAGNSTLNSRGWVLQEMVLSNRILHLMQSGVYWECRSECRTETGLIFDRSNRHNGHIAALPDDVPNGASKLWWNLVESYSGRQFTFPEDRLPAFSGVVRHYQMALRDTPILGLWKRTLHQDLLWMRVEQVSKEVDRTLPYLSKIPSWTWLSYPHQIQFDFWRSRRDDAEAHLDIYDHVQLIEWEVEWTSKPMTSSVKYTRLILEGPVREIVLSVASRGKDYNPPYLDADNEEPDFEKQQLPWRYAGQFDDGNRMSPTKYLCLLLRSRIYKYEAMIVETFLILEPCLGTDFHRRVGIGNFRSESRSFDLGVSRTLSLI